MMERRGNDKDGGQGEAPPPVAPIAPIARPAARPAGAAAQHPAPPAEPQAAASASRQPAPAGSAARQPAPGASPARSPASAAPAGRHPGPGVSNRLSSRPASRSSDRQAPPQQRQHGSSDRRASPRHPSAASTHGRPAASGQARQFRRKGLGLRIKFMLILCGLTTAALLGLGISVSTTTTRYLFGQKQHSGIEVARMAAMVVTAVADRMKEIDDLVQAGDLKADRGQRTRFEKALSDYFKQAVEWEGLGNASDILAVELRLEGRYSDRIGFARVGEKQAAGAPIEREYREIFLPKRGGDIVLPPGIKVFEAIKTYANETTRPIYRFSIALPADRFGPEAWIKVDVDRSSVAAVRNNVLIAVAVTIALALVAVVVVANWLAQQITRPVETLLKDMQVVSGGNLDHQTKATSTDEVGQLAGAFNRMTSDLKVAQHALVEQEKQAYELSMAKEVQRHLLPAESPVMPGFEVAAHYQGAKAVSGDYFDFIPLGEGRWGFIVADVSGKGIPGSMVMAVTRTIVRLMATKHPDRAAETLKETNRLIAKQIKRGMFVTAVYAILDERTGALSYASAGHNPIVIYRAATRGYELAQGKGIALGFNEGPIFDRTIVENRTILQPGDAFVLYTDGFPEAMNERNEEFGEERFYGIIAGHGGEEPRQLNAAIVAEVARHRGQAEQSDDLTLITVRRMPA